MKTRVNPHLLYFFVILLTQFSCPFQASAQPKDPVNLHCSSERIELPVSIGTFADESQPLTEFDFKTLHFLPPVLSCVHFAEELLNDRQKLAALQSVSTQKLITDSEIDHFRLQGPGRNVLYQSCVDSAFCHLKFPYSLSIFPWKRWWKDRMRTQDPPFISCKSDPSLPVAEKKRTKEKEEDETIVQKILSSVEPFTAAKQDGLRFWLTPETSLASELLALIRRVDQGTIYASTMTLGGSFWKELVELTRQKPKLNVLVFSDLNLMLIDNHLKEFLASLPENLILVPVASQPDLHGAFHIKGIAYLNQNGVGKSFSFSSVNLSDSAKEGLVELGWTTQDAQSAEGFAQKMNLILNAQCKEPHWLACAAEVRFPTGSRFISDTQNWIHRACKWNQTHSNHFGESVWPLFQFNTPSLPVVLKLIQSSKRRLWVSSHHFGNREIETALLDSKHKGLDFKLLIGHPHEQVSDPIRKLRAPESVEFQPHAKLVLSDDLLWIGSGNLTTNGLTDPYEEFWITQDPRFIRAVNAYFECVLAPHSTSFSSVRECFEKKI